VSLVYIILAHKNPQQLRRLVSRIARPEDPILIHVDRKIDDQPFKQALEDLSVPASIQWVRPRQDSAWGRIGLVHATLVSLRQALAIQPAPSHILQISGQCYPIKPLSEIVRFFEERPGITQTSVIPMPYPWDPEGSMYRLNKYHYWLPSWLPFDQGRREFPPHAPPVSLKEKVLNGLLALRFPLPRIFPDGLQPYGGHQWFGMAREMAEFVLDFHDRRPDLMRFHKHTWMPDEIYLSSIIGSFPEWRKRTTGKCIQYSDWSKPVHPAILTMEYTETLRNCPNNLFARKFDPDVDAEILDWIDENLLHV
jgi:hypothetical protein